GPAAAKYWAMIDENGAVVRQSGGITASRVTAEGTKKTRVTFPGDVSNCFWMGSRIDPTEIPGITEVLHPGFVSVFRSPHGSNVLEVATWGDSNDDWLRFDAFGVAVIC
ncbi:MAG TPA: hypothetical protein PLZ93_19525, partial [Nocardioides sp.]|nr:hypothetical protein [Nocardioides sp.]